MIKFWQNLVIESSVDFDADLVRGVKKYDWVIIWVVLKGL